jgi:hypothetical protein
MGRTEGGKSYLLKHFLQYAYSNSIYDWILFVSPSAFEDAPYIDKRHTTPRINDEDIIGILDSQKEDYEAGKSEHGVIVIDDCLGSLNFETPAFLRLFSTYRHYNLSVFICTQRPNKIPTTLRDVATYGIILRPTNANVCDSLYESFNTSFRNKKEWADFIYENTENYNALVVNRRSNGSYFTYRAPATIPDFFIS